MIGMGTRVRRRPIETENDGEILAEVLTEKRRMTASMAGDGGGGQIWTTATGAMTEMATGVRQGGDGD